MKVVCPRCNTSYNIPSNKIPQEKRATTTCKNCGGKIVIEPSTGKQPDHGAHSEPISRPTISPTGKAPPHITETDFINFIGKNSHKYVPKFTWFNIRGVDKFSITWHWPAFFVGVWWMLYRKLYLWALVAFVLSFIPFVNLLAMIAWGMTGNYIYYKHSKRKILKGKASQPPSISISLREIGGVNGWVPIVAPILVVGMLLAVPIYQVHHYRMRSYNAAAQADLRNAITAQKAYRIDNYIYADSIKKLIGRKYGLYPSKWVTVYVIDADQNHYMMETFHNEGNKKYIVMGPEGEIRETSRDRAWAKKGDYDQATADFTKALETDRRSAVIADIDEIVQTVPIPDTILPYYDGGLEHDGTNLWASVNRLAPEVRIYEIDPSNGNILSSYLQNHYNPASSNVIGLAYDSANNRIYNQVYPYGPIYAVNADTLVEVPESVIRAPASWIHDITFDGGNQVLWAITGDSIRSNYRIYKIRPSDGHVMGAFTSPTNAPNPSGLTWDGTYLWVSDSDQNLYQIDQNQALLDRNCDNAIIRKINLPQIGGPSGRLAWDGRFLWTASSEEGLFYKIDVSGLPAIPANPFPRNGASDVSVSTVLDWDDSSGATSYEVYLGTTSPPPKVGTVKSSSYEPENLNYTTTYCWQILAKNESGDTSGPLWEFTIAQKRKGQRDQAISDFTDALEKAPRSATAYVARGLSWLEKGNHDQAMANLNKALKIHPRYVEVYIFRAFSWQMKGKLDQAIADYTRALEINPRYAKAYSFRALIWGKKGDYDKAIADCNKALEINPRLTEAYYCRAHAWEEKGDYDRAIADYTRALEIVPRDAKTYLGRGNALGKKGDYDRAIADFTKALEINPRFAEAYSGRGLTHANKGDYDKAIADCNKALEINPRYAKAYYNRGITWENKGDYDRAIADFTKTVEINPRFAEAYYFRGVAWVKKGKYDQAISNYNKAIEINPNLAYVYNNRGVAYHAKGNMKKACSDLKRACELGDCSNWGVVNRIRCLGK